MEKTSKEIQDYLDIIYKVEIGEVELDDSFEIWGTFCDATEYLAQHPSEVPLECIERLLTVFNDERFVNPDQVETMEMILGVAYAYGETGFDFFLKHFYLVPDAGRFVGIQSALRMLMDWDDYTALLKKVLPKQTAQIKAQLLQKLNGVELDSPGNIDPDVLAWKEKFIDLMDATPNDSE